MNDKLLLQKLSQGLLGHVIALTEQNKKEQLVKLLDETQKFASVIRESIHSIK